MERENLSQSGIRRIADYSPYLDELAGLAQQMGLRQRSNLVHLEKSLHSHWSLGQNNILSWAPVDDGVMVLVVPHYAIAEYTAPLGDQGITKVSARFITELISGERQLSYPQMQKVARLLEVEPEILAQRLAHCETTEIAEHQHDASGRRQPVATGFRLARQQLRFREALVKDRLL